jgi:hypothetical protein
MKRLIPLLAAVCGALLIARGYIDRPPAEPKGLSQWADVAAFGLGVALVLSGAVSAWQGHLRLGWRAGLMSLALGAVATFGFLHGLGRRAPREDCDAALGHLRALYAAGDPSGNMVRRFDARRVAMKARCERAPDPGERRCVLSARSLDALASCPRW